MQGLDFGIRGYRGYLGVILGSWKGKWSLPFRVLGFRI